MFNKHAIFIVNLLQDVNILRPLIYLTANHLQIPTQLIVTSGFVKRDVSKVWQQELLDIIDDTSALQYTVDDDYEAYKVLEGKSGIIFAGSESDLSAHTPTHNLFKMAPSGFIKVTLQHGHECVGFLQSAQHKKAHGEHITFAADVVCGWFSEDKMLSMPNSQKSKLLVTGPTCLLQQNYSEPVKNKQGLICENLHSSRMSVDGDFKVGFIDMFNAFCQAIAKTKQKVTLRPHPGGQYVIKNNVELPKNVVLENDPIYKVDLAKYAYGVSAPSSILIDMILAEIPVAVWVDSSKLMDTTNYFGLAQVSSVDELVAFSKQAIANPERYLERQKAFLHRTGIITDPAHTYKQYVQLIKSATQQHNVVAETENANVERVMYIANDLIPTLQLSFIKPLADLVEKGSVISDLITEKELKERFSSDTSGALACKYIEEKLIALNPSVIVFCRYSGPNAVFIRLWAKQNNVPVIFHIDDDLLTIPTNIGLAKFALHNSKSRIHSVRYLLDNSDLVYCSTQNLEKRLIELQVKSKIIAGDIYCSSIVINSAKNTPVKKIGYMASADHSHNLQMILPSLVKILKKYPNINLEFFGSINIPEELFPFRNQINIAPPIANYNQFLLEFSKRNWDIGLCPLVPIEFNKMKAETKWVEYSACGLAVVATKGTAYDRCISDDCGYLADSNEDWYSFISEMIEDPEKRYQKVSKAQDKIKSQYSVVKLQKQVLSIFSEAKKTVVHNG